MSFGRKCLLATQDSFSVHLKSEAFSKVRLYQAPTLINYTFILFSNRRNHPNINTQNNV